MELQKIRDLKYALEFEVAQALTDAIAKLELATGLQVERVTFVGSRIGNGVHLEYKEISLGKI